MGRSLRDRRNYASEQHFYLLTFLAVKALRLYPDPNITIEDLITVGWYGQLRRVPENKLHGLSNNVLRNMYAYIQEEKKKSCRTFTNMDWYEETIVEECPEIQSITDKDEVTFLLSSLSQSEISLLRKYYVQGCTFEKIGNDIGMTRQGAQQRMQKVLLEIRESIINEKDIVGKQHEEIEFGNRTL